MKGVDGVVKKIKYKDFQKYGRPVQSLYNKFIMDPVARIIALPLINYTKIKPWHVTFVSLITAIASAWFFYSGQYIYAVILFQFSTILDGVDGCVARIKKNGSAAGILFDGYTDTVRVILNAAALVLADNSAALALLLFTGLHFAESFLDFDLLQVEKFLRNKQNLKLNRIDKFILNIKTNLEKQGLKVNFLHYQERLFVVFFLGPVFNQLHLFSLAGVILALYSLHLKLFLDISLIKLKLIQNSAEYLRGSGLTDE